MSDTPEHNAFDGDELSFDDFQLEGFDSDTPLSTPASSQRDLSFF